MKKLLIFAVLLAVPTITFAGASGNSNYFDVYSRAKGGAYQNKIFNRYANTYANSYANTASRYNSVIDNYKQARSRKAPIAQSSAVNGGSSFRNNARRADQARAKLLRLRSIGY